MLSIVNPSVERNGASTVTRGLLKALALPPFRSQIDCLPMRDTPVRWRRTAQVRSLLAGLISDLPAKAAFYYSKGSREKVVDRAHSHRYDLIVVNGSDLLWVAKFLPRSIPRILVAHNIEHLLFDAQIRHLSHAYGPIKSFLRADCDRLRKFELEGMREIENVIFLSTEEENYARSLSEGVQSVTIPPVFDYQPATRQAKIPGPVLDVGFIGNLGWWPNQVALRWFVDRVLPEVKSPLRLNLFGRTAGGFDRGDARIVHCGVVDDIEQIWQRCDFFICPAFSTGGICVKLAEAAYNGMPVLATSQAARGLPIEEDPALVFLDEPQQWAQLLNSADARRLAGLRTSERTRGQFEIGTHKDALHQFVNRVISAGSTLQP